MKFQSAPTTEAFDTLRLTSQEWEFGVRRVIFGWRVSANPLGWERYVIDYCAGGNPMHVMEIFCLLYRILSCQPEGVPPRELRALLPTWERRPIHKDSTCVPRLRELAACTVWTPEDTVALVPLMGELATAMQGAKLVLEGV